MIKHSIIIPTAGRPVSIRSTIQSILKQDLVAKNAELIIVDNNTDELLAIDLASHCQEWGGRLRYIREPSPGLSAARHRGAAEATGEWLTFLDDDVEVSNNWLAAVHKAFGNPNIVMVGGPSIPKFSSSIPVWFWEFVSPTRYGGWMNSWLSLLDIGCDVKNIDPNFIWGLNYSIRKKVLIELGGFHPDLLPKQFQKWQGDGETGLCMKIKERGLRADYVHDALVHHFCGPDRLTVEYFQRRAFFQGICNSYTSIRSGKNSETTRALLYRYIRRILIDFVRSIKSKLSKRNSEADEVKMLTQKSYNDGWLLHQEEVRRNPSLLTWIRMENYYNVDLLDFLKSENIKMEGIKIKK